MPLHYARHFWLRNKRRLADPRAILERHLFRVLRKEYYENFWTEVALAIGAQAKSHPGCLTQISRGGLAVFVDQLDLALDSAMTVRMMFDKALTYDLLSAKGLRVPRHCEYDLSTIERAAAFLKEQAGPVVVKPANGTGGGQGVTTGIRTKSALCAASKNAAAFRRDTNLLVEEQLTGSSFRLLYLDGEFIDAVRRDSPVVIGDGKSTIRQLVNEENRRRRTRRPFSALYPLGIDREGRNTLRAQGKSFSTVPSAGEVVRVKLAVNENASSQNHVVKDEVHEEIIQTGSRLVRDLGVRLAGLDVTAEDISAPLDKDGTIFNEINVPPGIHHHYLVANPEDGAGIAPLILERIFSTRKGVIRL